MDTTHLFGSALGLGFAAGIRLYATVLALGLAIRFHWYHLAPGQEHLQVLASPVVLGLAGLACAIEFISDKIPWVDSLWDSFHTIIRPIGAALLAATALGTLDPAVKMALIILCGGVAFTSHSSKAAARLAVNHSPEPFSNIALSLFEDLLAPFGVWLSITHPLVTVSLVLVFLAAFAWVAPRVFRLVRLEFLALWTLLSGRRRAAQPYTAPVAGKPGVADALQIVARNASPLPEDHCRPLADAPIAGIRCAATKNIPGLRNSIGYLAIIGNEIAFVTRRLFRYRVHRIPIDDISQAEWKRGLLVNRLTLDTPTGERAFYVFKDVDIQGQPEGYRQHR